MKGHGEKLTRKQEQAIAALLTAPSIRQAAATAGIAERTLRTWLALPSFTSAYRRVRQQIVEQAVSRLQNVTGRAVDILADLLKLPFPKVKLATAKAILDYSLKAVEHTDLAQRIEDLERQLQQQEESREPSRPG